jgi:hypothetical protein
MLTLFGHITVNRDDYSLSSVIAFFVISKQGESARPIRVNPSRMNQSGFISSFDHDDWNESPRDCSFLTKAVKRHRRALRIISTPQNSDSPFIGNANSLRLIP